MLETCGLDFMGPILDEYGNLIYTPSIEELMERLSKFDWFISHRKENEENPGEYYIGSHSYDDSNWNRLNDYTHKFEDLCCALLDAIMMVEQDKTWENDKWEKYG
jgi:predicted PolB exonuclease-like 3'-5' exonuclease